MNNEQQRDSRDGEAESDLRAPIRGDSLANQVFNIVRDAIFAGKFKPGESLREMHLARTLRVSQATVREALGQLEQVGLVVREQNRGTSVTSFTREEVHDRLEMRILMEELAAVRAVRRMSPEDFAELARLAERIAETIAASDYYENVLADMSFHQFIWQHSGSPILAKTLECLTTPLFAFLMVLHKTGLSDLRQTKSHEEIVEAMREGNFRNVRRAVRTHIAGSYSDFLNAGLPSLHAMLENATNKALDDSSLKSIRA